MASIILTGTLLDPSSKLAIGDEVRFTHNTTTGSTVRSAQSSLVIGVSGSYSIQLQYGLILVEYKDYASSQFKNLGVVTVNQDTTATTLPELLNAIVPPTDAQLLEFQAILADCVVAQVAAEAAASISEAFANQLTTTELIASTSFYDADVVLLTSGFSVSGSGSGSWKQNGVTGQATSQSPAQLGDALLNDGNGNQWSLVTEGEIIVSQMGDITQGAVVLAAFNAAKALAGAIGDQYPEDNQISLRFPSGRYNKNGSLITLSIGKTGISIYGDGVTSQLDNIQIEMAGAARCSISRLLMRGTLGYGIKSNRDGTGSFLSRQNNFSELYIRDKTTGVIFDGSGWNTWDSVYVEKSSGDGWHVIETSGEQIENSYSVSNSGKGAYIAGGGEIKMTNFLAMNNAGYNMHLYGTDAETVVEHYFTNVTLTGAQRNRLLTISSVIESGGNIQVTSTGHKLAAGMQDIQVTGTTNYNGTFNVLSVIDDDNFVLDATYIGVEASGSINLPNWDLVVESDSTFNARVNDQFFTGGNINYARVIKAFNVQFNGTRLKNQFYLDGGSSLINRTGMARGRNSDTFTTVEASGDTTGLVEDIFGISGAAATPGAEVATRKAGGSELTLSSDGVKTSHLFSGNTGAMTDDTVFSFTPQFSRGIIKITNGAGQNARVLDLAYDTDTPNTGLSGYQGAAMEFTTGVLTGTTGADARITVSAANDGKIYIENRSGNQIMYWTLFR